MWQVTGCVSNPKISLALWRDAEQGLRGDQLHGERSNLMTSAVKRNDTIKIDKRINEAVNSRDNIQIHC